MHLRCPECLSEEVDFSAVSDEQPGDMRCDNCGAGFERDDALVQVRDLPDSTLSMTIADALDAAAEFEARDLALSGAAPCDVVAAIRDGRVANIVSDTYANARSAEANEQGATKRWSAADWPNPALETRIDAVSRAAGWPVVGIVDEAAGGIVGYIAAQSADELFDALP